MLYPAQAPYPGLPQSPPLFRHTSFLKRSVRPQTPVSSRPMALSILFLVKSLYLCTYCVIISLLGLPRQIGRTTLIKKYSIQHRYIPSPEPDNLFSTPNADSCASTIMSFSMHIINSQQLLLAMELNQGNIWVGDEVHRTLDRCTMDRQTSNIAWRTSGMSATWASTSSQSHGRRDVD
jgi:hypothetical protein